MIVTERLELVPATVELTRAALEGDRALAASLGAFVQVNWPPELLDPMALEFTLDRLAEGPEQTGWWLHFVVLAHGVAGRTLVGSAGYRGPPSADGTVEVGYGIVRDSSARDTPPRRCEVCSPTHSRFRRCDAPLPRHFPS